MAMNLTRPGQSLAAGDANALFLKTFGHEVLSSFLQANKFMGLTKTKTITSGESATFPTTGIAAAHYHTPGESVITDAEPVGGADYLSQIKVSERRIYIDDVLQSSTMLYSLDEMKSHFGIRQEAAKQLGHALALKADKNILGCILAASLADSSITGRYAIGDTSALQGRTTSAYATGTAAADLYGFAFEAAEVLDSLDAPDTNRFLALRPSQYYTLVQYLQLVNKDYTSGNGGIDSGIVHRVAGFDIVKTNNMASTDLSAVSDGGVRNDVFGALGDGYNGDWLNVGAVAFQSEAVGTVKMMDLSIKHDYITERLSDLFLACYAMGHGTLRAECAVNMVTTAAAPSK